jgi:lysophospholipase L1-like esterase
MTALQRNHSKLWTERWIPRAGVVFIGVAALAALCVAEEFAFRWIRNHTLALPAATWVADPDLVYKLNPANSDSPGSLRGKELGAKRAGSIRIVCLGGSTTYGHGLAAEEAWPAALEHTLRQGGIPAEVINAGVPGHGSRQTLLRYRRDIVRLDADLVLVYEGWNRTGALVDPAGFIPYATPPPNASWVKRISSFFARHSLLLQSFVIRAQSRKQKAPAAQWSADPYQKVFASDLKALVQDAQSHGQRPVLILYPAIYCAGMSRAEAERFSTLLWDVQAYRPEMLGELGRKHAALRQVAMSTGSLVIDGQEAFADVHGAERRTLFLDGEHLSVAGCNKLAAALCERLTSLLRPKAGADAANPVERTVSRIPHSADLRQTVPK